MAGFEISSSMLNGLEDLIEDYGVAISEAEELAKNYLLDATQRAAEADPRWVRLADYIDTWDENDRFWIGIREPQYVSEAFAAEYGTADYPPAPILRTLDAAAREASLNATSYLDVRLPFTRGAGVSL